MRRGLWRVGGGLLLLLLLAARGGATEALVELGRPGPWAGVSGLIAYGARLYVVNSQIFVNHNAADIYSYTPGTGQLRFEHRLFSQDAGTPAIINGLLYWPYEDPRFSTTRGEFALTNGQEWQWRVAPDLYGFHVHAMLGYHEALYALVSAWRGHLYRSSDQGQHWELVYEYPSPEGQVSRLTTMIVQDDTLYIGLTAWAEDGVKLLRLQGNTVIPVSGWPTGQAIGALTAFQGQIYAVNYTAEGQRLWRSTGQSAAQPISALDAYTVQALYATATTLWAVGTDASGGLLWSSPDGLHWDVVQRFPETPIALTVVARQVFVGTYDQAKGGALWGPRRRQALAALAPLPPLPRRAEQHMTPEALAHALDELDSALADSTAPTYRQRLLSRVLPLALSRDPAAGQALSARLQQSLPTTEVALFGKQVRVPAERLARWYLLYGIAMNGHGHIPPDYLTRPWTAHTNQAEKYLEPVNAAAWAVTEIGQSDAETLAALEAALTGTLPPWAYGDIAAALYILTGRPFQYPPVVETPDSRK